MKFWAAIVLAIFALASHSSAFAKGQFGQDNQLNASYHYAGFNKVLVYMDILDIDYVGLEFESSFLIKDRYFIEVSHYDLSREYILSAEQINKRNQIRLGYRYPTSWFGSTDAYATAGWIGSEITSPFDPALKDDAVTISLGLKNRWWKYLQVHAELNYAQWSNDDEWAESAGGAYATLGAMAMIFENFSVHGETVIQNESYTFRLGAQFHF